MLFVDIVLTFFRAYQKDGRTVYGARKIAWNFLRADFWYRPDHSKSIAELIDPRSLIA
jgi:hypothetical protein